MTRRFDLMDNVICKNNVNVGGYEVEKETSGSVVVSEFFTYF